MLESVVLTEQEAALLNPLQMAYLGDAIWEVIVREHLILQGKNVRHMHHDCVEMVNAGSQAAYMECLLPHLSEEENAIFLRGRNSHSKHPAPRHQDPADYSEATGFEALIGYLHLTGKRKRIQYFFQIILREERNHA